jgi:8-oxo-dGTP pyrophosphatase MutT (NUDIX family)
VQEETGLEVTGVRFRGAIHVDAGGANGIMVFVFSAEAIAPLPFRRGTLEWVPRDQIDSLALVEDLPVLIPLIFRRCY